MRSALVRCTVAAKILSAGFWNLLVSFFVENMLFRCVFESVNALMKQSTIGREGWNWAILQIDIPNQQNLHHFSKRAGNLKKNHKCNVRLTIVSDSLKKTPVQKNKETFFCEISLKEVKSKVHNKQSKIIFLFLETIVKSTLNLFSEVGNVLG